MKLTIDLDLELGWKRYKKDLTDMCFADHPFEVPLIEANLAEYLSDLKSKLANYTPSRSEVIYIPKPNFHLRPGSNLTPQDSIIFQSITLFDIEKIRKELIWSSSKQRFAYILKEDQSKADWFVHEYKGWKSFREKSLEHIDSGYPFVLFADVSGYFENISIQRLISDIKGMGVSKEVLSCLSACLNRWAEPRTRGIPQGYRPSFILGEVYFNSLDKRLFNNDIIFCRYVDDFRIFCKSKSEAIESLHFLTKILREKELNLQTAKSYILDGKEARKNINGIAPIVTKIENELKEEIKSIIDSSVKYATPKLIQSIIKKKDKDIKLATVRKAFKKFASSPPEDFDKSLFHYCINRLGASQDDSAVDYCIETSINRPEEFPIILGYFSNLVDKRIELAENLIDTFSASNHLHDRQNYLLTRWIYIENIASDKILRYCRKISRKCGVDFYTREYAWAVLGNFGDIADLDAIEVEYNQVKKSLSKASILCSIKKMVEDRRNSIYVRAQGESKIVDYAIKWSKSL